MRERPAEWPWVPNSANICFLVLFFFFFPDAASGTHESGLDAFLVALRFTCVALPTQTDREVFASGCYEMLSCPLDVLGWVWGCASNLALGLGPDGKRMEIILLQL